MFQFEQIILNAVSHANRNPRFLRCVEASTINKFRPHLCTQKGLVVYLKLPLGDNVGGGLGLL